jgi:hypothetical protein
VGIIGKLKDWPENVAKEVNAAGLMVVFSYLNRDIENLGRTILSHNFFKP